eukprot:470528-Rhodomonas_salina.2
MSRVPTAVFLNINERAKRRSKFERRKLEDAYAERKEEWLRQREAHSVALKPSLGNSNARAELDALCAAENSRSAARTHTLFLRGVHRVDDDASLCAWLRALHRARCCRARG